MYIYTYIDKEGPRKRYIPHTGYLDSLGYNGPKRIGVSCPLLGAQARKPEVPAFED